MNNAKEFLHLLLASRLSDMWLQRDNCDSARILSMGYDVTDRRY